MQVSCFVHVRSCHHPRSVSINKHVKCLFYNSARQRRRNWLLPSSPFSRGGYRFRYDFTSHVCLGNSNCVKESTKSVTYCVKFKHDRRKRAKPPRKGDSFRGISPLRHGGRQESINLMPSAVSRLIFSPQESVQKPLIRKPSGNIRR